MDTEIKLTKLATCSGCGAKVGAGSLKEILTDLKVKEDENLLVGFNKSDDACVYKVSDDIAMVQTVDFFPPIADDPYTFGQIAATNALSDIYAMGGIPKTALNILTIPKDMDKKYVNEILRGGYDKVYEAGAVISGGHSIYDSEPKYGLSVTGFVNPNKILTNDNAKVGDVLVYTKPLGIGILTTAMKAGLLDKETEEKVILTMTTLNKYACEIMLKYNVNACTDVTGFSMLGHLLEMAQGSELSIVLNVNEIIIFDKALEYAKLGLVPEGAYRNRQYAESFVDLGDTPIEYQDVLFDPQTSGGLLFSLNKEEADKVVKEMKDNGIDASIIAQCIENKSDKRIVLNYVK